MKEAYTLNLPDASVCTGSNSLLIGNGNTCAHNNCIVIGTGLTTTEHGQVLIGNKDIVLSRILDATDLRELKEILTMLCGGGAAVPEHIRSIKIPTDAMEQEFQKHYRRGYEAGKSAAQTVPVVGEEEALICDDCGAETNAPWHSSKGTNRHYHRCDQCNSITAAELSELFERVISAQGFTDEKLLNLMKRTLP